MRAILYIKECRNYGRHISGINKISKAAATTDLSDLVCRKLIQKVGARGKGTKYTLPAKSLILLQSFIKIRLSLTIIFCKPIFLAKLC